MAPDVPPEETLVRFVQNPDALDYDLREQIVQSENCRRALHELVDLRLAQVWHGPELEQMARQMVKDGKLLPSPKPHSSRTTPLLLPSSALSRPPGPFSFGQVWSVSCTPLVWTGTRLAKRQLQLLLNAVIVSPPIDFAWDTIVRVVVLQDEPLFPKWLWGEREMEVKNPTHDYRAPAVVHLYLEFPMSTAQLGHCIGNLQADDTNRLAEGVRLRAEGIPLGSLAAGPLLGHNPEYAHECMQQTIAAASWFSATADALRLATEQGCLQ